MRRPRSPLVGRSVGRARQRSARSAPRLRALGILVVASSLLAACSSADSGDSDPTPAASGEGQVSEPATGPEPTDRGEDAPQPDEPTPLGGPSPQDERVAARLVAKMTLAERAGQVIVARYDGVQPPVSLVQDLHLGGVIVMGYNVGDPATLRQRNARLAQARGGRVPLVIAVDQEGGQVARVGPPATEFPTFMSHGAALDPRLTRQASAASGRELRAMGFTMVYAPDADVTMGPSDPTIGSRSAGMDPSIVTRTMRAAMRGYDDAGIVAVAKHFPGHGSVPADSHEQLPVQRRSLAELRQTDLVPFAAAARDGAPSIMVGHIDVRAIDPGVPSSLSRPVVTRLLRQMMGYRGVVTTDALDMAGVVDSLPNPDVAGVRALKAGADVLLMPVDPRATRDEIVAAVRDGRLSRARLTQAAERLVALMLHQGSGPKRPGAAEVGSNGTVSRAVSAGAATIVRGPCQRPLVTEAVRVVGGTDTDRARFEAAARRAGLTLGRGPEVLLLVFTPSPRATDIAVALDTPYVLDQAQDRTAAIALFGRTSHAFDALVEVLTGATRAPGTLPVTLASARRDGCG
jgi:beta-N-acetylhexosaminidase